MSNKKIEIQLTADGSHTLYLPGMDEHYHSVNGAIQESNHVYIESGLNQCAKTTINILEYGFGTGLNALLTAIEASTRNLKINYTTLEKYPLSKEIITQLNYGAAFSAIYQELYTSIHSALWENLVFITDNFSIKKVSVDFNNYVMEDMYDVIYYDAFAPNKQTDVWSQQIFDDIFAHTNPNGILTTYCAKGVIRRMLQTAGFTVERIPGPPGKREMLRARKVQS